MTLSNEIYRAFESIIGSRNISDDPALLDSYRYAMTNTGLHLGPYYRTYTPRGAAVLLPGSTEEVQGIVRLCNKHKIKYKASSTFWSGMGFPSYEDTIQIDMRRMDRILDIDEKNMIAVIEPYVVGGVLQAETMKRGLNTHIHGSGASCSLLASSTSFAGPGPDSFYLGSASENTLGIEWVMPDGEILRTGSLGSGLGWFCGEGPGPSTRGVIRGANGAMGAMGIFTKIALKLYPWPGPESLPVSGKPPAYKVDLPDTIKIYTLSFPSWEAWTDAAHLIWEADIGYIIHRQFNMFGRDLKGAMIKILTDPNRTLSDIEELLEDPETQAFNKDMEREFQIVLAGMTKRDFEWQERALNHILEKTGGWKVKGMLDSDKEKWSLLYMLRLGHKNLNLVFGGSFDGSFGMMGAPDFGTQYVEDVSDFKREWEKKGQIVMGGGDCMMGGVGGYGGGGSMMWENFVCFDPHDKDSTEGACEFFDAAHEFGRERGLGHSMERQMSFARGSDGMATSKEERTRWLAGGAQPKTLQYQMKIKEAFNPNDLGDLYYRFLEDPEQ